MKFSVHRSLLLRTLQDVMKAISSRTTIPILTGLKLTASQKGLTLIGSDSDISIEAFIPIEESENEEKQLKIQKPGSIVLQARFFYEIIRKLPENNVDIEVNEQLSTIIRSGKTKFNLNGLDPNEYPLLPQIDEENYFTMPADLLKTVIQQTGFAVATSETRPILTGVNLTIENNELTCIATDSHRLAYRKVAVDLDNENISLNAVVPGKSLTELSKILDDSDDPVTIIITDNQILFKIDNLLFFSRLLDGNYPDTKRLIPTESITDITVQTRPFLQSVERASLLEQIEKNNVVKLSTTNSHMIEISSNSPEVGNVLEQVNCDEICGEQLNISFSAKYMLDALKVIDGSNIKISFSGTMRPFVIRPLNDQSTIQLILPIRTF